jgi:hypothetical protein
MPHLPPAAAPAPRRRRRVPGARRFVAGALASAVAVFGVLALRVHAGDDPALGTAKASAGSATTTTQPATSSSGTSSVDPYEAGTSSGDDGSGTPSSDRSQATSGAQPSSSSGDTSSAAPTTRAS